MHIDMPKYLTLLIEYSREENKISHLFLSKRNYFTEINYRTPEINSQFQRIQSQIFREEIVTDDMTHTSCVTTNKPQICFRGFRIQTEPITYSVQSVLQWIRDLFSALFMTIIFDEMVLIRLMNYVLL